MLEEGKTDTHQLPVPLPPAETGQRDTGKPLSAITYTEKADHQKHNPKRMNLRKRSRLNKVSFADNTAAGIKLISQESTQSQQKQKRQSNRQRPYHPPRTSWH